MAAARSRYFKLIFRSVLGPVLQIRSGVSGAYLWPQSKQRMHLYLEHTVIPLSTALFSCGDGKERRRRAPKELIHWIGRHNSRTGGRGNDSEQHRPSVPSCFYLVKGAHGLFGVDSTAPGYDNFPPHQKRARRFSLASLFLPLAGYRAISLPKTNWPSDLTRPLDQLCCHNKRTPMSPKRQRGSSHPRSRILAKIFACQYCAIDCQFRGI